jgi:glycosyltransferase involved in cell wall biosynthesis
MAVPTPTFSVIVPAFNAEQRIAEVMRSVLDQTRRDLELIVVDDGSTDGTAALADGIAADDPRARVIRQPNAGTVAARNAGIDAAAGRLLSFLDDDDLWLPAYLETVAPCFEADERVGLVLGDAWVLDTATGRVGRLSALQRFAYPIRRLDPAPPPAVTEIALLRVNFVTTCAATVSRAALDAVGRLDPAIVGCDDWDLWLRIVEAGFRAVRVDRRLAVLRKRADSVGADSLMMARGARLVLGAALERGPGGRRAERIARRHARLVDFEISALEGGSRGRRLLAGAARRIGRKRLRILTWGSRQPPAELSAALKPLGTVAGGGQPGARSPADVS